MKRLMNSPEGVLDEALQGFASAHSDLVRFDPAHHTMFRRERKLDREVALISGGGSGHEPMHIGYVALRGEPSSLYQGNRGVAGTIVVEKIIGAAAEQSASLYEYVALGQNVNSATGSAVALTVTKFDEKMLSLWDVPAERPTLRCR
jgi:dihydroxyacetone kinase